MMQGDLEREKSVNHFLELIQRSKIGKFKVYIGMSPGVGKTYRMLQEAQSLLKNGVDIIIGYVETHNRVETLALTEGLPIFPRKKIFYKGKELEEMDLENLINIRPELVIVDELAHSNIPGSKNTKRWQDVVDLLNAGINVISAVNIQHIESLNKEIESITGTEIKERIPDSVLAMADEVVNIDLTAEELQDRLRLGKIYDQSKVESALKNFFQKDKLLQLREFALLEVAKQLDRKIDTEIDKNYRPNHDKVMVCINTKFRQSKNLIRKACRLADLYNSKWFVLYIQTAKESEDRIDLALQRHLINNFKLATELGAEILQAKSENIPKTIVTFAEENQIGTVVIGKPRFRLINYVIRGNTQKLIRYTKNKKIDILIVS